MDIGMGERISGLIRRFVSNEVAESHLVELTPEVSTKLRQLVLRPNPNLAEFPFLGLGKSGLVDQILVVNDLDYSADSGLLKNGTLSSSVSRSELTELFKKLESSGRRKDLMVFGHLHPSGESLVQGRRYILNPSDSLLVPSMGGNGKLLSGGDMAFFKSFKEVNPAVRLEHVGIVANTPDGPKFRVYNLENLLKIKKYSHIDGVVQQTIVL